MFSLNSSHDILSALNPTSSTAFSDFGSDFIAAWYLPRNSIMVLLSKAGPKRSELIVSPKYCFVFSIALSDDIYR